VFSPRHPRARSPLSLTSPFGFTGSVQTSVKSSATLRPLTAPNRWRSRLRVGAESSPRSSAYADAAVRRAAGTDAR